MIFEVCSWVFAGEGKLRIAVAYVGNVDCGYLGMIISLLKSKFPHQTRIMETKHPQIDDDVSVSGIKYIPSDVIRDELFMSIVMRKQFGDSYVSDKLVALALRSEFTAGLMDKVDPVRNVKRKIDLPYICSYGILQRNFNVLYKAIPNTVGNIDVFDDCLTFEIKVKGGLKGSSPFIAADRSIKLRHSRYSLMQLYKQAKRVNRRATVVNGGAEFAWGKFLGLSNYEPLLLCSRDAAAVREELTKLVDNPQNNLRMCLNGRHLYGWDKANVEGLQKALLASDFNSALTGTRVATATAGGEEGEGGSGTAILSGLLDTLAAVLCGEEVLRRMKDMQLLDLLDMEGAARAYWRLVQCFNNENENDDDESDDDDDKKGQSDLQEQQQSNYGDAAGLSDAFEEEEEDEKIQGKGGGGSGSSGTSPGVGASERAARRYLVDRLLRPLDNSLLMSLVKEAEEKASEPSTFNPPTTTWCSDDQGGGKEEEEKGAPVVAVSQADVRLVSALAALRVHESMARQELDSRRAAAEKLLAQATPQQCALLLQMWMVALVARDASVITTLKRAEGASALHAHSKAQVISDSKDFRCNVICQDETHCGVVQLCVPTTAAAAGAEPNSASVTFVYSVGVIDIGLKALEKVWKKDVEDAEICAICTNEELLAHCS